MTKIRKGRNPRFQRAINLAKETHDLVKAEVIAGYNTHTKLKDIDERKIEIYKDKRNYIEIYENNHQQR